MHKYYPCPSLLPSFLLPHLGSILNVAPLRLVGSYTPNSGRVEVQYYGEWISVCSNFWDINAATVREGVREGEEGVRGREGWRGRRRGRERGGRGGGREGGRGRGVKKEGV